ncbi:ribonuclease domain-containing protein [Kitasatospora sp. LaBMicrA B282]|uniref:ribonuclease domain-containing protein n=1 Tax=Kitasatospora sp. LaBMicrA B282 TaxID=3420949 RepID=UPI003D11DF60
MTARRPRALAATLLLCVTAALAGCGSSARAPVAASATGSAGALCRTGLPGQAQDTLALIGRGGPFPYRSDGVVFDNRERRLPAEPRGYYHEYTVTTPGAADRGARRIVTGQGGERYWTADHYASFRRIDPAC